MAGRVRITVSAVLLFGFAAAFAGAGCTMVDPKFNSNEEAVQPQPAGTRAVPVRFGRLEGRMRHGADIGRYTWGILCKPPYRSIRWETGRALIGNREYADIFYDALSHLGYDVAGDPGKLYEPEADAARAELLISGQVDEIALDLCRRYSWWFGEYTGYTGAALIRIVWTVYNTIERRVVYQVATTGSGSEDDTNPEARSIILERAFTDAAVALGKDEGFRRLVFQPLGRTPGPVPPGPTPITVPRPSELVPDPVVKPEPGPDYHPPPGFRREGALHLPEDALPRDILRKVRGELETRDIAGEPEAESELPPLGALPPLDIPRQKPRRGPMTANAAALVKATVVIASGAGDGSGFFVARDPEGGGLILTNAHVVGDALKVRVTTADRRARIGTVLRRHRVRDVALVWVDGEVPAVAAIREKPVTVGEEVFAIGEPLGFRNTVSRGVVSRFSYYSAAHQPVIQADVMVQHGSSGGPLTDAAGNVVGLCVAGEPSQVDSSQGLNWFIPIAGALEKLKLVLSGKA